MMINFKFNTLLAIAVFSGFSTIATVCAEEGRNLAPEATAAEAEGSFRDVSVLESAFIGTAPADRKDGISVGELE